MLKIVLYIEVDVENCQNTQMSTCPQKSKKFFLQKGEELGAGINSYLKLFKNHLFWWWQAFQLNKSQKKIVADKISGIGILQVRLKGKDIT